MKLIFKPQSSVFIAYLLFVLPLHVCYATDYFYPGIASLATPFVPGQTLANNDSLTVNSGILKTTDGSGTTATIAQNTTINVLLNSQMSYSGTSASPTTSVIYASRANNATINLNNFGTISNGSAAYSIYLDNTNGANTDTVNVVNTGNIYGKVSIFGSQTRVLYLGGTPSIGGQIDMSGGGQIIVGRGASIIPNTVFTTQNTISSSILTVNYGSTFTINYAATASQLQVLDGYSIMAISAPITATTVLASTNNGQIIVAADLNLLGAFNTSSIGGQPTANTKITKNVNVTTSTYNNTATHTAVMNDVINYGKMTLTNATPAALTNFTAVYAGGYLSSGDYTLLSANGNIVPNPVFTLPANTTFLTFSNLEKSANLIQITVIRTPYYEIATTPLTQSIAGNLELLTKTADVVSLLNGIERSATPSALDDSLLQLKPFHTAPLRSVIIQNLSMEQVTTRISALRESAYVAGDDDQFNLSSRWFRVFGDRAHQSTVAFMPGYSGKGAGVAFGMDHCINDIFTIGVAGGFAVSKTHDNINSSSRTITKSYQAMLYSSYNFDEHIFFDLIGALAFNNYHGNRFINTNTYNAQATSKYNNNNYSGKAVLGRNFLTDSNILITPEFSAQYTWSSRYSYAEKSAPGANLNVDSSGFPIIQLGLGNKFAGPTKVGKGLIIPEVHATVLYNVINKPHNTNFNFIAGGGQMISQIRPNRGSLRTGLALTCLSQSNFELKLNFDVDIQSHYLGYSTYLNLRYLF